MSFSQGAVSKTTHMPDGHKGHSLVALVRRRGIIKRKITLLMKPSESELDSKYIHESVTVLLKEVSDFDNEIVEIMCEHDNENAEAELDSELVSQADYHRSVNLKLNSYSPKAVKSSFFCKY